MFRYTSTLLATAATILALFQTTYQVLAQDAGIWQTYVVLEVDTPGNVWFAGGENADNATRIDSVVLGNPSMLTLVGGEIKSWKANGGDVTGAIMYYRVTEVGQTPGAFNTVNLPWNEDLPNAGDQKWQSVTENVNLLDSLSDGTYELEVYWHITTNVGDRFDNNLGSNYKALISLGASGILEWRTVPTLGISIYPNPANVGSTVQIDGAGLQEGGQLRLIDGAGRLVYSSRIAEQSTAHAIQLPAVEPGVYFAEWSTAAGAFSVARLVLLAQ